jgi:hypothetical protein
VKMQAREKAAAHLWLCIRRTAHAARSVRPPKHVHGSVAHAVPGKSFYLTSGEAHLHRWWPMLPSFSLLKSRSIAALNSRRAPPPALPPALPPANQTRPNPPTASAGSC